MGTISAILPGSTFSAGFVALSGPMTFVTNVPEITSISSFMTLTETYIPPPFEWVYPSYTLDIQFHEAVYGKLNLKFAANVPDELKFELWAGSTLVDTVLIPGNGDFAINFIWHGVTSTTDPITVVALTECTLIGFLFEII